MKVRTVLNNWGTRGRQSVQAAWTGERQRAYHCPLTKIDLRVTEILVRDRICRCGILLSIFRNAHELERVVRWCEVNWLRLCKTLEKIRTSESQFSKTVYVYSTNLWVSWLTDRRDSSPLRSEYITQFQYYVVIALSGVVQLFWKRRDWWIRRIIRMQHGIKNKKLQIFIFISFCIVFLLITWRMHRSLPYFKPCETKILPDSEKAYFINRRLHICCILQDFELEFPIHTYFCTGQFSVPDVNFHLRFFRNRT